MWEYEVNEFKNYLKLERSLSSNSIDASGLSTFICFITFYVGFLFNFLTISHQFWKGFGIIMKIKT